MSPETSAKFQQAIALHQRGQFAAAQSLYEDVLRAQPRHFDTLHLLGVMAVQTRNPRRAVELLTQAIEVEPHHSVAYFNRGLALQESGQAEAALASYDRALAIDAGFAEAYSNRGLVLNALGRPREALASYNRAIELKPDFAEAHYNRGTVLQEFGRREEALASYDRALAFKADYAEAHYNRGSILRELGRWDAALASYDRAVAIRPNNAAAHCNRGALLQELNEVSAALASYDRAIALEADFAAAHVNKAFALLLTGDFENGWAEHEWRERIDQSSSIERAGPAPRWLGRECIAGKTLLLQSEQGFGDTLQFCRFAKLAADRGARVILEVQAPLRTLLDGLEGVLQVRVPDDPPPAVDYYCPLLSLPLALGITLGTIPARIPYIRNDPAKVSHWKAKLGARRKLRVGLVWSGGFRPDRPDRWAANTRRNIPLMKLAALKHPEIEFFSLQKGQPAESEPAQLASRAWDGPELKVFVDQLRDFSDTAALMEQLDLVLSVDTASAHLAGALGKPVWILNRFDTCWRWMLERTDSPWYPTAKLYRQARPGDWNAVVERVRADLWQLVG